MKLLGRRAFTLVELLVVIGIIGMLIALLMPAVLSSQEQARQLTCNKQMKDMAGATLNFVLQKQRFPGYADTWTVKNAAGTGTQTYEVGWLPQIFANLDMDERLRDMKEWNDIDGSPGPDFLDYIPLMVCPSDPPDLDAALYDTACGGSPPSPAPGIAYPTSYAVNGGKPDFGAADSKEDALFHDRRNGVATKVAVGLEDIRDGKQHTLLLTENVDLVSWDSVVPFASDSAANGRTEPHQAVLFNDNAVAPTWVPTTVTTVNFNANLIAPYDCSGSTSTQSAMADNLDYPNARPSSFHTEGFNIAYADGHVELFFVDQSLLGDLTDPKHPYRQYRRMMTPNRGD